MKTARSAAARSCPARTCPWPPCTATWPCCPTSPWSVPDKAIGTNTVACMQSGCILGAALLLDGMIGRMEEELGQKATVVATGGIAPFITPACKHPMAHADDLILRGLAVLYAQNK